MKVLFVTGFQHDAVDEHGGLLDGKNVLPKPFDAPELVGRVQTLLSEVVKERR